MLICKIEMNVCISDALFMHEIRLGELTFWFGVSEIEIWNDSLI